MRLATILLYLSLIGCTAPPQTPTSNDPVITANIVVSSENLHHYWTPIATPYPSFPYSARSIDKATCVNIAFIIGQDGRVHNPTVIKVPPNTSKRFQKAALKAIKKFTYQPAATNSAKEKVITHLVFSFYQPLDDHSNKKTQTIVDEIAKLCLPDPPKHTLN
ncbi:energy transducer TonB [Dasania sp. GY-MA-18]|uniref:Energy transducer TonB n=1 Tax=Dasania phycosphaerae TaxID=2950436 RepID=A0A9J6RJZ2_9GAMM|nr:MULTISPECIES: energy transducer TonB [Dasania]MCR8922083.1 energy transducer TonB [Dasania sp. GY-MA-18]MCZ0864511.1 energy transducer TonB [Dasania phycosphaerae]MCZ0868239.1 energy transducer TonB [Dasania phycosphaerae]